MAGKFLSRLKLPLFTGDPTSPAEGEMWYNQTLDQVRYRSAGTYNTPVHAGIRLNDWAVNRWYHLQTGASSTAAAAVNRCYTYPFVITRSGTLSGVAMDISTAFATTAGTVRAGIYDDDGGRMPTNRVVDLGTLAATVGVKVFTSTQALGPGIYWVCAVFQGSAGTAGATRTTTGYHEFLGDPAVTPAFNSNLNTYYSDTGFTGALPATFGTVAGIVSGPRFAVRFSA
jgi:hypothetical protein